MLKDVSSLGLTSDTSADYVVKATHKRDLPLFNSDVYNAFNGLISILSRHSKDNKSYELRFRL